MSTRFPVYTPCLYTRTVVTSRHVERAGVGRGAGASTGMLNLTGLLEMQGMWWFE